MPANISAAISMSVLRGLVIAAACISVTYAQTVEIRNLNVDQADRRIALVIGNAAYKSSPLKNPVNDARAMAAKLKKLGFEVIEKQNLPTKQIGATLREFRSRLKPGTEAVFFYAGHGLQVKGVNYLPAVDADITAEEEVPMQSINVNQVLEIMEEAKTRLNLIFLDACRNNPFSRRFRSAADGLAKVNAPSGTLISFATRPGSVAADGEGQNGLYTEQLLLAMDQSNVPIEQVLKKAAAGVKKASKGQQEPWSEGMIEGEFYFIFNGPTTVTANPHAKPAAPDPAQVELSFWDSIKASQDKADFEEYLRKYPTGQFTGIAKNRMRQLTATAPPVATPQPATPVAPSAPPVAAADAMRPGKVFKDCADCPEMVMIPAGSFDMGSNNGDSKEKPVHSVSIARPFALGKTEVTQGQWRAVMGSNPSSFSRCGDSCPVENVSWDDAGVFIQRLNVKTGKSYRLPSEAEWEYACRAGGRQEYCGGDSVDSVAWYGNNSGDKTQPAAGKQANAWGLYDMSGNVWEWTEDCLSSNYSGAPSDGAAWTTGDCARRVLRGGSWYGDPQNSRSARRGGDDSTFRYKNRGFRLARMIP